MMIMKNKKNPHRDNAVKRIIARLHDSIGWLGCRPYELGIMIFYAVYAADKYDVLNKLSKGFKTRIFSYMHGDIRKKQIRTLFVELIIILIVIV